jgi:small-conductance mechanosensitive channel
MSISPLIKHLLRRTGVLFLVFLAALIVPQFVTWPPRFAERIDLLFKWIAAIALFFQVAIWSNVFVTYWSGRYIERHGTDPGDAMTIRTVSIIAKVALWGIIAINVVWMFFRTSLTGLVAGLGVGGIAIAFALQNVLTDLFASLSIVLDKPFVIGDAIQVDNFGGTVERIGIKSTRVRAYTGEQIIFGNGDLLKGRIRNYGRMDMRQATIVTRVAATATPDQLQRIPKVIREIIEERPATKFVRSTLTNVGDAWFEYTTLYNLDTADYNLYANTQQGIMIEMARRFDQEQIRLAARLETLQKEKIAGLI